MEKGKGKEELEMSEKKTENDKKKEVFLVEHGRCKVMFAGQDMKDLFDEVVAYRDTHHSKAKEVDETGDEEEKELRKLKTNEEVMVEAIRNFKDRPGIDAIARAVYQSRFVDYILKYTAKPKMDKVRRMFEEKLARKGLVMESEQALDPHNTYIKIYSSFQVLSREAQKMNLNLPLKGEEENEVEDEPLFITNYINPSTLKNIAEIIDLFSPVDVIRPSASAPFRPEKLAEFKGGLDDQNPCNGDEPMEKVSLYFFPRAKRILLTHDLITRTLLTPSEIKKCDRQSLLTGKSLGINEMVEKDIYSEFFPLHDGSANATREDANQRVWLKNNWCFKYFKRQPIDEIREYYGEKIALYFAFLGFYTVWLWSASLVGLIAFIYGIASTLQSDGLSLSVSGSGRLFDNPFTIPFSAFVCIWATFYLEFWKRKNAYLAWWWDVMDYERDERPRPEWYGTRVRISPITGKKEFYYPERIRLAKMMASCFCIAIAILFIILSVMGAIVYNAWAKNYFGECSLVKAQNEACIIQADNSELSVGCTDPCYSILNELDCLSSPNFTIVDLSYKLCTWNTEFQMCIPDCLGYNRESPCKYHSNLPENFQESSGICSWTDVYFISSVTGAIINLIAIVVLTLVFEKVAFYLNYWENHKTQTQFDDAFITKTFFFQFLNNYTTLFYIAFFKGTLASSIFGREDLTDSCQFGSCFTELMIQLAIIFVGKQLINQIQEIAIPFGKQLMRKKLDERQKKEIEEQYQKSLLDNPDNIHGLFESNKPPQWVKDDRLDALGSVLFDDYNEMAIQFGFITMFVPAFPLAPFFALVNNVVEIRTDSYKLVTQYQRPPTLQAQDIGTWEKVMHVLAILSVITNAFLCAFTSGWVQKEILKYTDTEEGLLAGRLIIVLVFEHVVLGIKFLSAYLIPDTPAPVQLAIDRENYLARAALEGLTPDEQALVDEDFDELFGELAEDFRETKEQVKEKISQFKDNIKQELVNDTSIDEVPSTPQ